MHMWTNAPTTRTYTYMHTQTHVHTDDLVVIFHMNLSVPVVLFCPEGWLVEIVCWWLPFMTPSVFIHSATDCWEERKGMSLAYVGPVVKNNQ